MLKSKKRWKYDDLQCERCHQNVETGEEILQCEYLGSNVNQVEYSWFYSEIVTKQILTGKVIMNKLGLSWAKLSSNWNWNFVLLHLRFVALNLFDYIN